MTPVLLVGFLDVALDGFRPTLSYHLVIALKHGTHVPCCQLLRPLGLCAWLHLDLWCFLIDFNVCVPLAVLFLFVPASLDLLQVFVLLLELLEWLWSVHLMDASWLILFLCQWLRLI